MDIEKEIREHWFKDHIAKVTDYGDIKVLEWRKPDSYFYYTRYVFDGRKMYITGDIGEAVFCLTWKADVHNFNDIGLHYFVEKLEAYHTDVYDFNSGKAVNRLKEWQQEFEDDGTEYDEELMNDLISEAECCNSKEEWVHRVVNGEFNDFISELDADYWEWFYTIGDEIDCRIKAYLIGLKMASEQLRNNQ